jgi:hypothetical protein
MLWKLQKLRVPAPGAVAAAPGRFEGATVRSMSMRHFSVVVEWDSEDEIWVTHVPALDHLSTYGHTREAALSADGEGPSKCRV